MKSSKSNNSILFLTTLGVYLGLVLVGASPVLGHAATTRNFEISEDIEVKDDLDRKPEDEQALIQFAATFEELCRIAHELSESFPEKGPDERFSFDYFVSVNPRGGSRHDSPSRFYNGPRVSSGKNSHPLRRLYDIFLSREETWHEKLLVQFGFGVDEVTFKTTITESGPAAAALRSSSLSKALSRRLAMESNVLRAIVFQAMEVSVEGDRIIVVTRLPRAALDAPPATDAK